MIILYSSTVVGARVTARATGTRAAAGVAGLAIVLVILDIITTLRVDTIRNT
jgi:hypothetical protein